MPEGPEIRRAADRLAKAVAGKPLTNVWFARDDLKQYEQPLVGQRIESFRPHGKALLTRFEGGLILYSHNQLYGVWKIAAPGARPDTKRSLRAAFDTARKSVLLYSASDISMWSEHDIASHPFLQKLGPDVLDPELTDAVVATRLQQPRFNRRQLAVLLLDQGFLAGMGNYLRSEVLFAAGLDNHLRPCDLASNQILSLAEALLAIPRSSYRSRGIRPARGMRADYLEANSAGFRFAVFDRAGEPCYTCGDIIIRREHGGRRLYLCPTCQPRAGVLGG